MTEVGATISLDGVAVHPDCWCVCLCYLHFAPENPEDGKMYLLVPAHPDCPGQSPESHRMVLCVRDSYMLYGLWLQKNMGKKPRPLYWFMLARSHFGSQTSFLSGKLTRRM